MTKSEIANQIAALEVHVPTASRYQREVAGEVVTHKRRGKRKPQNELDADRKEVIFTSVVEIAKNGERCPTAQHYAFQHSLTNSARLFSMLAADGRIRIEVTARNWRTVWICEGEHRGLNTQEPATRSRPYMVLGPGRP